MAEQLASPNRGPIEVVESKGVRVPIYTGLHHGKQSFLLSYYADGVRVRERAPTIEEARRQAKAKIQELTSGAAHVSSFSARETSIIQDAVEVLRPTGMSLSQVAREYAEASAMLGGEGTVLDAVKQFIVMREEQRRKGALKAITVPELVENAWQRHPRAEEVQTLHFGHAGQTGPRLEGFHRADHEHRGGGYRQVADRHEGVEQ